VKRWWGSGSLQAGPIERGRVDCSLRGDFVRRTLIFTYNATNALLFFFSRASENCVNTSLNILTEQGTKTVTIRGHHTRPSCF